MIKNILITLLELITNPVSGWKNRLEKQDSESEEGFLKNFFYPVLGITSLTTFVVYLLTHHDYEALANQSVQAALKETITLIASYFLGFYAAVFVSIRFISRFFPELKERKKTALFIGYNLCILMAFAIIITLIDFSFLRLAPFYIGYIIWEAARLYWVIPEGNKRITFVVALTALIMGAPWFFQKILSIMIA